MLQEEMETESKSHCDISFRRLPIRLLCMEYV